MNRAIILCLTAAMLIAFSGMALSGEHLPKPDGQGVWEFISKTSPYSDWEYWPGHEGMYPGKSPHGAYLKLYANQKAIEAARNGEPMPDGALLVKENYAKDKETLAAITPMYKVEGYNEEAGDWFWAKYGPDGEIMAEGKVQSCIGCHQARQSNEWIFTEAE